MIEFTVELKDKTVKVMADSVDASKEGLTLYQHIEIELNNYTCPLPTLKFQSKNIVGIFKEYERFYISGENNNDSGLLFVDNVDTNEEGE